MQREVPVGLPLIQEVLDVQSEATRSLGLLSPWRTCRSTSNYRIYCTTVASASASDTTFSCSRRILHTTKVVLVRKMESTMPVESQVAEAVGDVGEMDSSSAPMQPFGSRTLYDELVLNKSFVALLDKITYVQENGRPESQLIQSVLLAQNKNVT